MPFRYRLQKFLEIRIRKKEEQLQEVRKAQAKVDQAQANIDKNNAEIAQARVNMRQADPHMMDAYDKFLKHLYDKGEELVALKIQAEEELQEEVIKLQEREKEVNVLEKHKERAKEVYLNEEKAAELKQLSEIAVQKHFAKTLEKREEELLEELMLKGPDLEY